MARTYNGWQAPINSISENALRSTDNATTSQSRNIIHSWNVKHSKEQAEGYIQLYRLIFAHDNTEHIQLEGLITPHSLKFLHQE